MIKAIFLIIEPLAAWDRVATARKNLFSIFAFYLLPMMLIVALVEGYAMIHWGRVRPPLGEVRLYSLQDTIEFEISQMLLMGLVIVLSSYFIKGLGETFRARNTYVQTFTVVAYGLSPVFLLRLLDVVPGLSLWIPWAVGVVLMAKILYIGVPRIMEPDPPHAFGLFMMSALLLTMITAAERFISIGYLIGKYKPLSEILLEVLKKFHLR
jgi:nitrate reductase NapE component